MAKLPCPPTVADLQAIGPDMVTLSAGTTLWRVHRTGGANPAAWDELRHYGPSASARFDPHGEPPRTQSAGVAYLALDVPTALAEVFRGTRVIALRRGAPHLTGFETGSALDLLDLTGEWPLRAGASHIINTGRRDVTRAWARAFVAAWPHLHGLRYTSSMTGHACLALYTPGQPALPASPAFSEPLSHVGLTNDLADAAQQIGYLLSPG